MMLPLPLPAVSLQLKTHEDTQYFQIRDRLFQIDSRNNRIVTMGSVVVGNRGIDG